MTLSNGQALAGAHIPALVPLRHPGSSAGRAVFAASRRQQGLLLRIPDQDYDDSDAVIIEIIEV